MTGKEDIKRREQTEEFAETASKEPRVQVGKENEGGDRSFCVTISQISQCPEKQELLFSLIVEKTESQRK